MRTSDEIREAHSYLLEAHKQAMADGNAIEVEKLGWILHTLIWTLGHGEIFASVVEVARKTKDDAELDVHILEATNGETK